MKNTEPAELVRAVRVVAAGDGLLSPSVNRRVIGQFARRPARLTPPPATAKTHVSRAMVKLGARDSAQVVVFAYEAGLVRPSWLP